MSTGRKTRTFLAAPLVAVLLCIGVRSVVEAQGRNEAIEVDVSGTGTPFPHYWERMFGSGRAILSLRDSYRQDLRAVKEATGFEYIRFHEILHDELGVYDEVDGKPAYNFSYVDQIYDGLLQAGVRPFVELSFMPKKLAAQESYQAFSPRAGTIASRSGRPITTPAPRRKVRRDRCFLVTIIGRPPKLLFAPETPRFG